MFEFIPDADQLSRVFSQAAAPAFFLGAVTGLVSILTSKLTSLMAELRSRDGKPDLNSLDLLRRAQLLHSAINFALASGMSTALLLLLLFAGGFYRIQHLYGAGILFGIATALVAGSLFQFYREIRIGLQEFRRLIPFKREEDRSSRNP